ncbi:peptidylprolyl isomerase [Cyclobacteriaceae bacterium]|nr:peptidylprolyl isomerase [Cyclobacteriaceae bacterium]MDB4742048.1 peptidylprolyl isomerase [Cyclobacteriaceae bacterium]
MGLFASCVPYSSKYYDIGQIKTPYGEMLFWLYEETPKHKKSFLALAKKQYWDTLTFNRVIKNFVIQGGCPDTPDGFKDSPYLIAPEFQPNIRHIYGAVGAGRDNNPSKLSASCQLYIVHDRNGIPRLDDNYMIFGQLFKGFDVLDRIAEMPTDTLDQPLTRISMEVNSIQLSKQELIELGVPWINDDQ